MSTETVPDQEEIVDNIAEPIEPADAVEEESQVQKEERVPLSALQKERKKRQEAEEELKIYRAKQLQEMKSQPVQEDDSKYESATKEDLGKSQHQIIRAVEERNWIKQNPEKAELVNEKLAEFLKQRPNLASAIEGATNRYEEAWELMDKLTPKQKAALKPSATVKKDTPGNPAGVPKAAALNQAVDVMSMSDSEFAAWRQSQRRKR